MKEKKVHFLVDLVSVFYYLAVFTLLLVFFVTDFDLVPVFLISIMALSAIPDAVEYIVFKQYRNIKKIGHIIWSVSVLIACIVMFTMVETIDISTICIIWGVVDIARGLDELYTIFFDGKFQVHEIPDLILAIADVILGIILIIKLDDGLNVHLIAATISILVFAVRQIINVINYLRWSNIDEKIT